MARTKEPSSPPPRDHPEASGYTVIARRYRPQCFEDVVGQDHVVQSLRNAIRLNRVTHAYLFSGTRGVGKTSIARIFAKCLNCVNGPTEHPCNSCDICQAISTGQDVDVIEIDGASNNGVEAVRELRQNAGLRPSRCRFKIYYIDEVHMLSTGAFNALLKTLEEPPEHVKFFFATTEPNRIPITVLSRCQRYDFAGISPEQVVETLQGICEKEHVAAEPDALRSVARRAGGSMRDAQSLLEQLLSAGNETLTVELVHKRLGTASDERLLDLIDALADHNSAQALRQLDQASNEGVQPTDLLNGLLEFLRDVMVLAAGSDGVLLSATPRQKPRLQKIVDRWSLDTIVAALQILAEARGRLRGSPHGRLLVELALVRVARLENLTELGELIGRLASLESGAGASGPPVKKKSERDPLPSPGPELTSEPVSSTSTPRAVEPPPPEGPSKVTEPAPAPTLSTPSLELDAVRNAWPALIRKVGVRLGLALTRAESQLAISGPNQLAIPLPEGYNWLADDKDAAQARSRIEHALHALLGQPVSIHFERAVEEPTRESPNATGAPRRRDGVLEGDPMVQKIVELFEARPLQVEFDDDATRASS